QHVTAVNAFLLHEPAFEQTHRLEEPESMGLFQQAVDHSKGLSPLRRGHVISSWCVRDEISGRDHSISAKRDVAASIDACRFTAGGRCFSSGANTGTRLDEGESARSERIAVWSVARSVRVCT